MWQYIKTILLLVVLIVEIIILTSVNVADLPSLDIPENAEKIPKKLHMVFGLWDDGSLPKDMARNKVSWENQGWTTKLWNKKMCLALLDQYPEYKDVYQQVPRNVQKADIIRYLIVYHEGGYYVDLDCVPRKSLYEKDYYEHLFFIENKISKQTAKKRAEKEAIRQGKPELQIRIANFALGAKPRSAVLKSILDLVVERCRKNPVIKSDYEVLYTTGPDAVTEVVTEYAKKIYMSIPLASDYMRHACRGSWRGGKDNKN